MRAQLKVAVAAVVLLLAGCSGLSPDAAPSTISSTPSTAEAPSAQAVDVNGVRWGHVHNLGYEDGGTLLLGTHEGLYRQQPGQQPVRLSETTFDVMALAHDGERWHASGHPGEGEDLPADLGLRTSPDGRAWTTVSLLGEVDFHRIAASGSTVLGVSAHDSSLLRSTDAGATWSRPDNPGVFDVALEPGDPATALATTQTGPVASRDGGDSWAAVAGAPLIALVVWTWSGVYGISPDGGVYLSTDDGVTWKQRGSVGGQPAAAAADGDRLAVLAGGTVMESGDRGKTFAPRLTGVGAH